MPQKNDISDINSLELFIRRWIKNLKHGEHPIILIEGQVGAGKTTLASHFIPFYLGKEFIVQSPTYSIYKKYAYNHKRLIHADLYRLETVHDLDVLGLDDDIDSVSMLIEWPDLWIKSGRHFDYYWKIEEQEGRRYIIL